jgi:uncharacterized membrane protein YidH (DUF202 family)
MPFALITIALTILLFMAGLAMGRSFQNINRGLISPALEIALSASKSLIVFVAVLVALFALKQEFDHPQIFKSSNINSYSTK